MTRIIFRFYRYLPALIVMGALCCLLGDMDVYAGAPPAPYSTTSEDIGIDPLGDPISNAICAVIKIFLGPVGRVIATLAIFFMGIGVFTGRANHWQAITIGCCIAGMYGSVYTVEWLTGYRACAPIEEPIVEETEENDGSTQQPAEACDSRVWSMYQRTEQCPTGQVGSIIKSCVDNTWQVTSNTCAAVPVITCDGLPVGSDAPFTTYCGTTGRSLTYVCSPGGEWRPPLGVYCENPTRNSCDGKAPGTQEMTACPGGQTGFAQRRCKLDGNWEIIDDSGCTTLCTADDSTPGLSPGNQYPVGSINIGCPPQHLGKRVYICGANGQWVIDGCCEQHMRWLYIGPQPMPITGGGTSLVPAAKGQYYNGSSWQDTGNQSFWINTWGQHPGLACVASGKPVLQWDGNNYSCHYESEKPTLQCSTQ